MTTKKSMVFLLAVIIICITFMTTYYFGQSNKTLPPGEADESLLVPATDELRDVEPVEELKIAVTMDTLEYLKLFAHSLEFEAYNQHLNLKIEIETIEEEEAYDYFKRTSQLGEAPDIMLLDNAWVNEFAALGYLAQLDDVLSSNMSEMQIAPLISQVKWNGFLWAVPKEIDPYMIAWNVDRLMEHEREQMPQTIEELLVMNDEMVDEELEQLGFYIDLNDPYAFITLISLVGGQWEMSDGNYVIPDDEQTLHRLLTLLKHGHSQWRDMDEWEALNEGAIAFMLAPVSSFNEHAAENIAISAVEFYDEEHLNTISQGGWLMGKSFAVSSKSPLKKEAFEWIQAVTTTDVQLDLMQAGGGMPAMIAAYADRSSTLEHFEQIAQAIEGGLLFKPDPKFSLHMNELQKHIRSFHMEEMSLLELVTLINEAWQQLTE